MFLFILSYIPFKNISWGPQIGVIKINDAIMESESVVKNLNDFHIREDIDAIILRINSPGGGVAASQEIYEKVKQISEQNKKPIIASMATVAASGGYYIACGADTIIANRGTTTGSIGVIMSYPIAARLMQKIGLQFQSIKSGELKDAGNFSRVPTKEELDYFQNLVDDLHRQFVDVVAYERGMLYEGASKLATGEVFSGQQAFDNDLVDIIGTFDDSIELISKLIGINEKPKLVYPKEKKQGVWDILSNNSKIDFPFSNMNIFPLPEYSLYYGGNN